MLEVARAAAADRIGFPRTVVFVAFAGEELGLLGSEHYVAHPAVPLDRTVAMINLDMIGRPDGRILVSGLEWAPSLDHDLQAAHEGIHLRLRRFEDNDLLGASDDAPFLAHGVPAIGFFSGFHPDYHKPSDRWERIDAAGAAEVARLALALARQLAQRTDRPGFTPPN
jgi:Zn-dependent M28 family amino/carboxypeptidase